MEAKVAKDVAMRATPALSLRVEGSRGTEVQRQTSAADPSRGDSPMPRKSLVRHQAGPAGQDRATLHGGLGERSGALTYILSNDDVVPL